jgi:predicted transcriptional regulator
MASKVMKIGIISWEDYKARNRAIARGELKPKPTDPKVWMPSMETAAKVLSEENIALLRAIQQQKPKSVTELAFLTNRKQGNVSRTLKTMSRYGIAELRETSGRAKRPVALATEFQVELRTRDGIVA